jgi:hypothetical protein
VSCGTGVVEAASGCNPATRALLPCRFVVLIATLAFGMITPPYGLVLLMASKFVGVRFSQALRAALPIYVVFFATIAFAIYFPQVVLWLPKHVIPTSVGCFKAPTPRAFCQIISATAMNRAAGKGVTVMDSHQARARAEASFKKEERAREGAKAMMEYEAEVRATQEKTARLRALRLAKEAADKVSSPLKSRANKSVP